MEKKAEYTLKILSFHEHELEAFGNTLVSRTYPVASNLKTFEDGLFLREKTTLRIEKTLYNTKTLNELNQAHTRHYSTDLSQVSPQVIINKIFYAICSVTNSLSSAPVRCHQHKLRGLEFSVLKK